MFAVICVFLIGSAAAFPMQTMAPFPSFNSMGFDAFNNMQNLQSQNQKQAQAASTGDASADFGNIASNQNSNQLSNDNGTLTNAGSQGGCSGGNCALSGAAQLQNADQFQKQHAGAGQNITGAKSNGFGSMGNPFSMNLLGNMNTNLQKQTQKQTQIGGAATGTGAAQLGNVTSNQNTVGETNQRGGNVLSTNVGSGLGTGINLNGASQAKLDTQEASQIAGQNTNQNINNAANGVNRPGCANVQGSLNGHTNNTLAKQKQNQQSADAASAGQGTAAEGAVNSAQQSNVTNDKKGTLSSSNNVGQASGKGLHLSGATSSNAQGAAQKQASLTAAGSQAEQNGCV